MTHRGAAKKQAAAAAEPVGAADGVVQPLALLIADKIEEDIVLGRRHPRERLIEQELCAYFGTHRGDVRLALFELEKRGIVQRIPNRGAIVRDLTPQEVQEIYAVREELEVMAVRILPLPVASADLRNLVALQQRHSRAVDAGDLLVVFYSNLQFHRALFGLCGNACLIETIDQLAQKVRVIRSSANADAAVLDQARRDHVKMIEALQGFERDELIALTRRHLKAAPEAYARAYRLRFGEAA
jgi:DNA-binding GntR family transcriptional regulator